MPNDDQTPATKADVRLLMEQIGTYYQKTEQRMATLEDRLHSEMGEWKREIMEHFDLTVETIRHDLLGAHRDDIAQIKDDIRRLKQHTGLPAV